MNAEPLKGGRDSRRGWWLSAAMVAAVALVTTVFVLGHGDHTTIPTIPTIAPSSSATIASTTATQTTIVEREASTDDLVDAVTSELATEPLHLSGVVFADDGLATTLDIVSVPGSIATVGVSRLGGGHADVVARGSTVLVKGDADFWLSVRPGAADTFAGAWVAVDGQPALTAALTPALDLVPVVDAVHTVSVGDWERGPSVPLDGVDVISLTSPTAELLVSAHPPHHVVSLVARLAPTSVSSPTTTPTISVPTVPTPGLGRSVIARHTFATDVAAHAPAQNPAPPPPGPSPQLALFDLAPATPEQVTDARTNVDTTIGDNPTPPAASGELPVPIVHVTLEQVPPLCEQPTCSLIVTVSNDGTVALDGGELIAMVNRRREQRPVPALAAGTSMPFTFVFPNTAPQGQLQTVLHTAFVYVAASQGPDPSIAEQLPGRGVPPNYAPSGDPMNAPLIGIANVLTMDLTTDDLARQYGPDVLPLLDDIASRGYTAALLNLINSGRLSNPEKLRSWLHNLIAPVRPRAVHLLNDYTAAGHNITLSIDGAPGGFVDADTGQPVGAQQAPTAPTRPKLAVPAYSGHKTSGTFIRPDGTEVPLISGRGGPAGELGSTPGMNRYTKTHVEANASAIMRAEGLPTAVLWINRAPCPTTQGCDYLLSRMLPPGVVLWIYVVPEGSAGPIPEPQRFVGV